MHATMNLRPNAFKMFMNSNEFVERSGAVAPGAGRRPQSGRRFSLKCQILMLSLLAFLGTPALAFQTSFDFYIATQSTFGEQPGANWTWTLPGVTCSGTYLWACGFIVAGDTLRSHAHADLEAQPYATYTGTVSAGSEICDAYFYASAPDCYDVYVNSVAGTNGFKKVYWRSE